MDTIYHSNIPIETLSLLDCDVRNFNFIHPIKNIFFDNIDYIRKLDVSGKARPCILDNVERSLLCHTCYLGFDQFIQYSPYISNRTCRIHHDAW